MKSFNEILVSVSALIFICSGCIRAISKELRAQVTEEVGKGSYGRRQDKGDKKRTPR